MLGYLELCIYRQLWCAQIENLCKTVGNLQLTANPRALAATLICLQCLIGCDTHPVKSQTREIAVPPTNEGIVESTSQRRQLFIREMLREAEIALQAGRLSVPAGDNALDRYRAVLAMEANNLDARTGLQQVAMRYVHMGWDALRSLDLAIAKNHLQSATRVAGSNPLTEELRFAIVEADAMKAPVPSSDSEFVLSGMALEDGNPATLQLLERVASQMQSTQASLLIVARNDAEGRWLYKQIRKAALGYRVRGDIVIDTEPKLVLLPPL